MSPAKVSLIRIKPLFSLQGRAMDVENNNPNDPPSDGNDESDGDHVGDQRGDQGGDQGGDTPSPWDALSDPIAGYGQVLASLLASQWDARAAVVQLEQAAQPIPRWYCALGVGEGGAHIAPQLSQWARQRNGWWAPAELATTGSSIQVYTVNEAASDCADSTQQHLFQSLQVAHALLIRSQVQDITLLGCVLIGPQLRRKLTQTMREAQAALPAICGRLALVLAPPVILASSIPTRHALSRSERAILPMLLQHLTENAIADRLNRSPNTIHAHVKSIYRKLGVRSRSELRQHYNPHAS